MKTSFLIAIAATIVIAAAATASAQMGYQPSTNAPRPTGVTTDVPKHEQANTTKEVRASLVKPLNEAIELGKKGDFKSALATTKEADASVTDKGPYEEYVVSKMIGQYAGQLHDDATAAAAFDRALASGAMPEDERAQMLRLDMGENINAKNFAKAVTAGEELQKSGKLDADAASDLSLAYYQKGDYKQALKTAQLAADQQSASGAPREQTLKILMNSQVKVGDQPGAKKTHDRLCALSPQPSDIQCGAKK